jgi:hypothetical protein
MRAKTDDEQITPALEETILEIESIALQLRTSTVSYSKRRLTAVVAKLKALRGDNP